jgi:hypothetical protein
VFQDVLLSLLCWLKSQNIPWSVFRLTRRTLARPSLWSCGPVARIPGYDILSSFTFAKIVSVSESYSDFFTATVALLASLRNLQYNVGYRCLDLALFCCKNFHALLYTYFKHNRWSGSAWLRWILELMQFSRLIFARTCSFKITFYWHGRKKLWFIRRLRNLKLWIHGSLTLFLLYMIA